MKTISRNRWDKFLPLVRNPRCFSLSNSFSGTPVQAWDRVVSSARALGFAKLSIDTASKIGKISFHGNEWYEFEVAA